ncbi:transporter substrate-binding domain-containing protein (plasmid) [Brucella anthropi]|uniref:Extracellular solute-binding protein family 3 n=1 Tax=Brucella anthropi (strain ATCC 49188 / DSM 6882 / CCUG 24695 / JCM 21032 / LMG 3331 / NBRC 15819 / NCTC 12168 / Alc 37) TaxID=439375 RepID=A6X7J9_BRUA4|nr:transporter substrate-binding domain-containing protein [Brucella anthropi]ABS17203.1 extracellular solute-binding protein family 3 [Brucella anthropi ATCC 49188]KAB2729170.1 transporter substrate-binding domain-containing protein [Brucella anthropi]QQC26860.1 transporter substrate-binding domain-containing protein [Brucella anthropi]SUB55908.1 Sulfate starvation-induced protein 7 [Brucella anthropi]
MKTKLFIAAMAALVTSFVAAPASADMLDDIIARKTIRVAVPTDYPPFGSVGSDMQPQGMDIDMARLIAKSLGVEVELIPVTAPNRVAYLQTGKSDLTISSLGKTEERAKVIDFSIAYSPFFDAVFGAKNPPIEKHEDLTGHTIAVTRGSMQDQELEELAPGAVVKRFEDNNSTIAAFISGQVAMFASGTPVAAAIKKRSPDLDLELKIVLANSPCYVGVAKGETRLLEKVNSIIREAKASGEVDRLSLQWLGAPSGDLPE